MTAGYIALAIIVFLAISSIMSFFNIKVDYNSLFLLVIIGLLISINVKLNIIKNVENNKNK